MHFWSRQTETQFPVKCTSVILVLFRLKKYILDKKNNMSMLEMYDLYIFQGPPHGVAHP